MSSSIAATSRATTSGSSDPKPGPATFTTPSVANGSSSPSDIIDTVTHTITSTHSGPGANPTNSETPSFKTSSPHKDSSLVGWIVFAILVVLAAIIGFFIWRRWKRRREARARGQIGPRGARELLPTSHTTPSSTAGPGSAMRSRQGPPLLAVPSVARGPVEPTPRQSHSAYKDVPTSEKTREARRSVPPAYDDHPFVMQNARPRLSVDTTHAVAASDAFLAPSPAVTAGLQYDPPMYPASSAFAGNPKRLSPNDTLRMTLPPLQTEPLNIQPRRSPSHSPQPPHQQPQHIPAPHFVAPNHSQASSSREELLHNSDSNSSDPFLSSDDPYVREYTPTRSHSTASSSSESNYSEFSATTSMRHMIDPADRARQSQNDSSTAAAGVRRRDTSNSQRVGRLLYERANRSRSERQLKKANSMASRLERSGSLAGSERSLV